MACALEAFRDRNELFTVPDRDRGDHDPGAASWVLCRSGVAADFRGRAESVGSGPSELREGRLGLAPLSTLETTLGGARTDDLVVAVQCVKNVRDSLVGVGPGRVGAPGGLRAHAWGCARSMVLVGGDECHWIRRWTSRLHR